MVATTVGGGSIIGQSATIYESRLWLLVASLGIPIGHCITSAFIIPKLSKYYGCLSVAEVAGRMYGTCARKLIGVSAFVFCLGALSVQTKALYWVMQHMFPNYALIVTAVCVCVFVLYSTIGGVSSVIRTDVVQFFTFIVIILLAGYVIHKVGRTAEITNFIFQNDRDFFHNGSIAIFISLILVYLLPEITPPCFHRFLVGRDCKKNQIAFYVLALINLINTVFISCVAFIVLIKFSNINPKETLFFAIENFAGFEWMMVLFNIALITVIVCT